MNAGSGRRRDAGSVTAEFALLLPAVVVLLALALGAVRVVVTQVQCVDAARAAARVAARGESLDVVQRVARAAGPAGAVVRVDVGSGAGSPVAGAGTVRIEVSVQQRLAGPVGGAVLARGSATAAVEAP
ncbi:TadE family type IV pilus minor pilin [Kineococcus endophyticus]|uniref:TadE family type IV pilus minor pilin n=1 Tax=Kineococcus endophyticus TaxID=1181883 RepID=A0ABV3P361_9ACTN